MSDANRPHITILHSLDEVPVFMCEVDEAAFWETHELGNEILSKMTDTLDGVLPHPRMGHTDEDTTRREE